MYAGPDPDKPVTASSWLSSSSMLMPTASNSARAVARSSAVARLPGDTAVAAAPTSAGVFGIARTTRTPSETACSIVAVSKPAAIEMRSVPGLSRSPISRSTLSRICGLTLSTTTLARSAALALSTVTSIPYAAADHPTPAEPRVLGVLGHPAMLHGWP